MSRRINPKTGRRDLDWARTKRDAKADQKYHKSQGWKNVRIRKSPSGDGYLISGTTQSKRRE